MEKLKVLQQTWDSEKKKDLIVLGQGPKTYAEILLFLENEIASSQKMTDFSYTIPCFMNDGIYQLSRAIEENIGVASVNDRHNPSGSSNMETIDIVLANGVRKKIFYGDINLPGMGENAKIAIKYHNQHKNLYVTGSAEFKYQTLLDKIVDRTIELLNTDSIYKNQSIEIDANVNNGQPRVMDLSHIDKEVMILSDDTDYSLRPIYARLKSPEKCAAKNIPIKFGAMLEGMYGSGKTLLAFKLSRMAVKNNYATIYLKSPELLADTLRMAKRLDKNGNGILLFVEDIDQVTRGDRNAALQDILNTLDGGDTKDMNVISLFTTNHLELIEPTFLRGKRIGTIISMGCLNADTAEKYIKTFCSDIDLVGDFAPVYKFIEDNNIAPAFMAEIIESLKSNMIVMDETTLKAEHFHMCVNSYLRQVNLTKTKDTTVTPEIALAQSIRKVLHDEKYYEDLSSTVDAVINQ